MTTNFKYTKRNSSVLVEKSGSAWFVTADGVVRNVRFSVDDSLPKTAYRYAMSLFINNKK